eukprot:2839430-Pyramimonas_sp.AAC.1
MPKVKQQGLTLTSLSGFLGCSYTTPATLAKCTISTKPPGRTISASLKRDHRTSTRIVNK